MYNDLQHRVGEAISSRMRSEGISTYFLAREIHHKLGVSESTAPTYIWSVCHGALYGSPSDLAERKPYGIKRLAILLYALGFDSDDPIVADLRRSDARFKYPPKNSIPYDKIRKKLQSLRQRKWRTLSLDGKIALLSSSKRAEVKRFVDDLLQQSSSL